MKNIANNANTPSSEEAIGEEAIGEELFEWMLGWTPILAVTLITFSGVRHLGTTLENASARGNAIALAAVAFVLCLTSLSRPAFRAAVLRWRYMSFAFIIAWIASQLPPDTISSLF